MPKWIERDVAISAARETEAGDNTRLRRNYDLVVVCPIPNAFG